MDFFLNHQKKKKKKSASDGLPNNSLIKMKKNAKWIVYLQPNWNYDVTVTMGSQDDSTYNINVTSTSGTYILAQYFFFLFYYFLVSPHPLFEFLSFFLEKQQSYPWCQSIY